MTACVKYTGPDLTRGSSAFSKSSTFSGSRLSFSGRTLAIIIILLYHSRKVMGHMNPSTLTPHFFNQVDVLEYITVLIGNGVELLINHKVTGPKLMMNIFVIDFQFMKLLWNLSYGCLILFLMRIDLIQFSQQVVNDLEIFGQDFLVEWYSWWMRLLMRKDLRQCWECGGFLCRPGWVLKGNLRFGLLCVGINAIEGSYLLVRS